MSLLNILEFPDTRLRKKARPVEEFNDSLLSIVDDMFETMYEAPGIGLAATQVNIHQRIIVIDISEDKSEPLVFINPEVTILDPELLDHEEGCLSVPGYYERVERPSLIKVKAFDATGKSFELETDGLLAVCIQHEIDHLNGKLFVDYLSMLKRQRIKLKLEKEHKLQAINS